ncbi:MAG: hypothetical protein KBS60_00430, partial [Phascolarctobacterium sp.]|nr:hypothetical protein [Candidatus Phascolarctobacterium caballi]
MPTVKSSMTDKQYKKCRCIIHSAAAAAAGGHAIPGVSGAVGLVGDLGAIVSMTLLLFDVFGTWGGSVENSGKEIIAGNKTAIAKFLSEKALEEFGVSTATEGFLDWVPLGNYVAGGLAARKTEKIGWKIAVDLYDQNTCTLKKIWHRIWYN